MKLLSLLLIVFTYSSHAEEGILLRSCQNKLTQPLKPKTFNQSVLFSYTFDKKFGQNEIKYYTDSQTLQHEQQSAKKNLEETMKNSLGKFLETSNMDSVKVKQSLTEETVFKSNEISVYSIRYVISFLAEPKICDQLIPGFWTQMKSKLENGL